MDTYKKKYKGALARCKWLLSEGMISRIAATDLFRELMDNDSENVRREIINIFHSLAEGKIPVDINYADIFTWLEKQGEQKPRYSIGDVLCDKSCTTLNKDVQPNFEITDIRNGMYICDKCSFPISQQDEYELVAKRIEQKPTFGMKTPEESLGISSEEYKKIVDTCLYDEKIESNPAWTEEDKRVLDALITSLINERFAGRLEFLKGIKVSSVIDWLKSLKEKIKKEAV